MHVAGGVTELFDGFLIGGHLFLLGLIYRP